MKTKTPTSIAGAEKEARRSIHAITERYQSGEISFAQWQESVCSELKMLITFAYLAGLGGPKNMDEGYKRDLLSSIIANKIRSFVNDTEQYETETPTVANLAPMLRRALDACTVRAIYWTAKRA